MKNSCIFPEEYSDMKIPVITPIGVAIDTEKRVMRTVPTIGDISSPETAPNTKTSLKVQITTSA